MQILDHCIQVEGLELFGVDKLVAHRVGQVGLPVQHAEVELLGPPVCVAACASGFGLFGRTREWTGGLGGHGFSGHGFISLG
jgi:hypothetical protein